MVDSVALAIDRIAFWLAAAGACAAFCIHLAAWYGLANGFEIGFALMSGCGVVGFRVVTSAQPMVMAGTHGSAKGKSVFDSLPPWVDAVRAPLMYYAIAYSLYVAYTRFVRHVEPTDLLWARLYSAFALCFYIPFAAILRAALQIRIAGKQHDDGVDGRRTRG